LIVGNGICGGAGGDGRGSEGGCGWQWHSGAGGGLSSFSLMVKHSQRLSKLD